MEQNYSKLQRCRSSRKEIQEYYRLDQNNRIKNGLCFDEQRDCFRPLPIRHHKSHSTNSLTHRDSTDTASKRSITPSSASARLKSEIDQISSKLKLYGDLGEIVSNQCNQVC